MTAAGRAADRSAHLPAGPSVPAAQRTHPLMLLARRLGWFAALWLMGVAAVGIVAYGIRALVL